MTDLLIKIFVKDYNNISDGKVRERYGLFSSIVAIFLNILLFVGKFIVGFIAMSATIQADAFNNLSDAGSSIVTLIGFKLSNKPIDDEHPFGHGRFEYLSGLIVSMMIVLVGIELIQSSVTKIINREFTASFSWVSIGVLVGSILVKLWMYFFVNKLGNRINSEALKASALDSKSDVFATLSVLVSALIIKYTGFAVLDALMSIAVGVFILISGFGEGKETIDLLLGQAPDKEFVKEITHFVQDFDNRIVGTHDLVVHNYGPGREMISIHVEIPNTMNIDVAHELIDNIEFAMKNKFNCHVVIHMDPVVVNDEELADIKCKVRDIVKSIDQNFDLHDFVMTKGEQHSNLIFDLVRTSSCKLTDEQIVDFVRTEVKKINKGYEIVVNVEQSFC